MTYAVKEIFDTVQGEGARAGERSLFVRFSGCNLWDGRPEHRDRGRGACSSWCDTDFLGGAKMTALELLAAMREEAPSWSGPQWCVLTGGEPLLQVDAELLAALRANAWSIAIETNGTIPLPGRSSSGLWVTCSPKIGGGLELRAASEVKVILPGGGSGWTDDALRRLRDRVAAAHYFVQPQDPIEPELLEVSFLKGGAPERAPDYQRNVERCMEVVRKLPGWRLSVQAHKLLGVR